MLVKDYMNECAMSEQTSHGRAQAFGANAVLWSKGFAFVWFCTAGNQTVSVHQLATFSALFLWHGISL